MLLSASSSRVECCVDKAKIVSLSPCGPKPKVFCYLVPRNTAAVTNRKPYYECLPLHSKRVQNESFNIQTTYAYTLGTDKSNSPCPLAMRKDRNGETILWNIIFKCERWWLRSLVLWHKRGNTNFALADESRKWLGSLQSVNQVNNGNIPKRGKYLSGERQTRRCGELQKIWAIKAHDHQWQKGLQEWTKYLGYRKTKSICQGGDVSSTKNIFVASFVLHL